MKKKINPYLLTGLIITGIMLAITIIGVFWTPYAPTAMKYGKFQMPSAAHIFGTDNFGRDIFSRVLKGTGTTFSIALMTVTIGAVVGTMVDVGRGRISLEEFRKIIESRNRSRAGESMPAKALFLANVTYQQDV